MDKKHWDEMLAYAESEEGQRKFDEMIAKMVEDGSEVVADIRSFYQCTWNGGSDVWNTGFCDNDCRSYPYSEGAAIVEGKKYRFKKALTEEDAIKAWNRRAER